MIGSYTTRSTVPGALATGLLVGLKYGLTDTTIRPLDGLLFGLVFGLVAAVLSTSGPSLRSGRPEVIRQISWRPFLSGSNLVAALGAGLVLGLPVGFLWGGLVVGLVVGLLFALTYGLANGRVDGLMGEPADISDPH